MEVGVKVFNVQEKEDHLNVNKVLVNKSKLLCKEELDNFSKEELIDKVLQLQSHNLQLRNIIAKRNNDETKKVKIKKEIDFDRCPKVHIALKFLYLGWDYQGYACQEDSSETIEHHLINALLTCQLIKSRETSNYHRCGRTDKGVSSFDQTVSITVRASTDGKLDYCKILNRLLPHNIRVISWFPVSEEFSARFNCTKRMYKYFFPKSDLDIQKMNDAAQLLLGVHDFRNLCKMDVANGVTNFTRSIEKAFISEISGPKGYEMCQFELIGKAFLWHQVRCIMSVLLLVGKGLEEPSVVSDLLDVQNNPRKPQYQIASPIGLNLYKCYFENIDWNIDKDNIKNVVEHLQKIWTEYKIKTTHIESMIDDLVKYLPDPVFGHNIDLLKNQSKQYKRLMDRNKCNSLEDRIEHYVKKRKIEINQTNKI